MEKTNFTYLLQNPQNITVEQTSDITSIINKYPYFQPARVLYLKGLKNKGSFKYNQELKITAAYTTDRSILFDYITSEAFNQNEISLQIKQNSEHLKEIAVNEVDDISVNKSVIMDDALKQHIKDTEGVLDPNLFEEKVRTEDVAYFSSPQENAQEPNIINVDVKNIEQSPEETLGIGKPFEFNITETHSFTEWLKIASFKPISRAQDKIDVIHVEEKETTPIGKKLVLIDKFLKDNPKITPTKGASTISPDKTNEVQHDGLMTETLARIYLEQKNYDKAIQSYRILSLKYPEKSGFFADQIRAVKQLQENNNPK